MLTYHNLTAEGIYISLDLPLLPEIVILCIVMAIWVFSIMQFIRYRGTVISVPLHPLLPMITGTGLSGSYRHLPVNLSTLSRQSPCRK